MIPFFLFLVATVVLAGAVYVIWQLWWDYSQISSEEIEFETRVASLNNDQANRISDGHLIQPVNSEDAWRLMIRQGRRRLRADRSGKYQTTRRRRP